MQTKNILVLVKEGPGLTPTKLLPSLSPHLTVLPQSSSTSDETTTPQPPHFPLLCGLDHLFFEKKVEANVLASAH